MTRKKIGVFDSGVGGLFVLQKLAPLFPQIHWIYFADTAHWPYGNKTKEQLHSYCSNILKFLDSQSVEGILIACNTASSLFMKESSYKNKIPLINIIEPSLAQTREHIEKENIKKISVLATQWTVQSDIYKTELLKLFSSIEVFQYFVPELTFFIENNQYQHPQFKLILKNLIQKMEEQKINTLILGCTHYLVLKEKLKKLFPLSQIHSSDSQTSHSHSLDKHLTLVNPIEKLIQTFKKIFEIEEQEKSQIPLITLYSNQKSESLQKQAQKIMNLSEIQVILVESKSK